MGSSHSSAFYVVVHQPCDEETNTCLLTYNQFLFNKIGTRRDSNIHKAFAYRYLSSNIYTGVEEWTHGYFCLGYFSSSTHFYLVKGLARKVWRQCVLVFTHFLGSRGGNWNGLLANTGLLLCTGNRYLFLLQRQCFPFDSLPRLQIQFSNAWRQSFVNGVSDLFFFSPLVSTFESWEPICFDESPCRTVLIRFWVDQTHVSSNCTDFPRSHRMEFLTSTTKLRPILYWIPECCHREE